jgi:2-beta-glucuronyltransferase
MNILFLSAHLYPSKHKAGFHHLADAANALGHTVSFCTVPNTPFNIIYELFNNPTRCWCRIKALYSTLLKASQHNIQYSTYFSIIYPMPRYHGWFQLKALGFKLGLSRLFFKKTYDTIIVESCAGLLLIPKLKKKYPHARFIYRVSDCLEMLDSDPKLMQAETNLLPQLDLISTPVPSITSRLQTKCPSAPIATHTHGINTNAFNQAHHAPSPYTHPQNAIYIGMYPGIDWDFLDATASQFPHLKLHIFGPYKKQISHPNIIYYGTQPFHTLLPYIVHATIGLHIKKNYLHKKQSNKNLNDLSKTLKFMQYTYAKLPIIAPQAMQITEPHVFSYTNDPISIKTAVETALNYPKEQINTDHILSWESLVTTLLTNT